MDWFRSWHGAPTDPKWLRVARYANVNPGTVVAIAWNLFDHASQCEDRGDVSTFDVETCSIFTGFEDNVIIDVMKAMITVGVIVDGRLAKWDKRQPAREPTGSAAERQARSRARRREAGRDVTPVTPVTPVTNVTSDVTRSQRDTVTSRQNRTEQSRPDQSRSDQSRSDSPRHDGERDSDSESETPRPSSSVRQLEHNLRLAWSDIPRPERRTTVQPISHGEDDNLEEHAG